MSSVVIESVSPADTPFESIEQITPAQSPFSDVSSVTLDSQLIEFTSEWFNYSSKVWRCGKIFSKLKQMFYYKTNTDSLFTLEDYKTKKNSIYTNPNIWSQCGYIDSNGYKCQNLGIFYNDEIKNNKEYDYEKYTDIHFCEKHTKNEKKEKRKRYLHTQCVILERQLKNYK
jgi:hypothetical protein